MNRLRAFFLRRRLDNQLDDEVRAHLEMLEEQYVRSGMNAEEARYAARRSFGGVEQMKETYRDRRGLPMIETLFQDAHYALRMLRKTPAFTAVAVLSLALGIGANTAVFTLINAILLRMLPVEDPGHLVVMQAAARSGPAIISFPMYRDLRAGQQVFTDMFASAGETPVRLTARAANESTELDNIRTSFVTGNYFSVLGIRPVIGRFFSEDEDRNPNSSETQGSIAVLSYTFWERQFGRDPRVLDRTILVNRSRCRVIGVASRGFAGEAVGSAPDLWVPLISFSSNESLENRQGMFTSYMARLKPGVTREQAQSAMTVLFQHLLASERSRGQQSRRTAATPIQDYRIALDPGATGFDYGLRRTFAKPLWIIMAIVAVVLLIACANVANLLLARAASRQREISVRLALGCGRRRLVRQLLTESLLLSSLGALAGVAIAVLGSHALVRMVGTVALDLSPDREVLAFMAVIAILSGILFGTMPACRASRVDLAPALTSQARSGTSRKVKQHLSRTLVVAQVALSLLLLIGAGLLIRSIHNVHTLDLGFRPEHVLIFDLIHNGQHREPEALARVARQVYQQVRQVPGVESASLSGLMIFGPSDISAPVKIRDYIAAPDEPVMIRYSSVSPGYFETVGMTLIEGRAIEDRDREDAPRVAVINQSMARRYFSRGSPVGRVIEITPFRGVKGNPIQGPGPMQIIGVVRDAKYNDLRADVKPMFYVPLAQLPRSLRSLEVCTSQSAAAITGPVRQALLEVTKDVMIRGVRPLTEQVDRTLAGEQMIATLCTSFGILALLLASVGLYGVMSYAVAQRTSEIGIRMALGATRRTILALVLRQSIGVVCIGVVVGTLVALACTRLLTNFLFGLTAADPATIICATLLLAGVSVISGYLPARRATRIDPMAALRTE